jgi:DEAD/DEAH box helicase domain-containing protein
MQALSVPEVLDRILRDRNLAANVVGVHRIPAAEARFADYPAWVDPRLVGVLKEKGYARLYTHQARAIEHVHAGRHVVVVTPTASGKTLCYNVPVLSAILDSPESRALYLFPTKALAQDQMNAFHDLVTALGADVKTFTYDGDTPADARAAIRRQGHVVVSNPDMLHAGILPHHTKWQKLFANLKFVVLDELHTYRGVFGSHVTNVLRRLRRVCRFYGADPVFLCCSATIANPKELAEKLLELPVELVDESGAPRAEKVFLFYNPPVVNKELGIRAGSLGEARKLAERFIQGGVQTLVFATSRLNVEVLTKYLKDRFDRKGAGLTESVAGYRGGYLPKLRRSIEAGLRARTLLGVVSTNALELGIDIGALEAVILAGYPGTIASTWQQAGRAGRRSGMSAAILVARSNPLDQYIVTHPDYFLGQSPEHGRVNPDNLLILTSHVKAAAFELPFEDGERFGGEDLPGILEYLEEKEVLHHAGGKWHWSEDSYPADAISLRNVSPENFVVVDRTDQSKVIAEVDFKSAPTTIHQHAIYMVESRQHYVDELDWERRRALVHDVDVDYYTDAMTYLNVRVLDEFDSRRLSRVIVEHGEVQVTWKVIGFKKIKFYTGENVGYGDVNLPEQEMHTTAYWFTLPQDLLDALGFPRADLVDGLLGLAHVLRHVAAVALMCDPRDLDSSIGDKSNRWTVRHMKGERGIYSADGAEIAADRVDAFDPTLFLFDAYPGGIGLAEPLFTMHEGLLARSRELIAACPCESGCPSCVGPAGEMGLSSKPVALAILGAIA